MKNETSRARVLQGLGLLAFALAGLSIVDMYVPKPYDGIVLDSDVPGLVLVRHVLTGSGAETAGIRQGDQIVGIDRSMLRSTVHAAEILNRRAIGDTVAYLVRSSKGLREVAVLLGPRRIGGAAYLSACLLGFVFFFVGLFVLRRQPDRRAAQLFFVLGTLFLLFLVCRLRPASYSWVDTFVLTTGMVALLFLPATFLHFFLIFPRPVALRPRLDDPRYRPRRQRWLLLLATNYLIPPVVLLGVVAHASLGGAEMVLISGAPAANWWVLAIDMLLGLSVLYVNGRALEDTRERRGAALVFVGSLLGLLPFLVLAVGFSSVLHDERYLFYGVAPLALIPLSFAYAIVRFQLMDVKVLLRKSLLYTGTTVTLTALYGTGIGLANTAFRGSGFASSPYFPVVFALLVVLLFEPVRHWLQVLVDRFFRAEETRLRQAMMELGAAFSAELDLRAVVRDLVEKLPRLLSLRFAALYLVRDGKLARAAGPELLPRELDVPPAVKRLLAERRRSVRRVEVETLESFTREDSRWLHALPGIEVLAELSSPRRTLGLVLLSGKTGQLSIESDELDLLDGLLHQAAIGLETSLLLEERAAQIELERDLEIASEVQSSLLPPRLDLGPGFVVEAVCRPARHVGGDFYTQIGASGARPAIVYGDVAGKSVSGALVMMAAHEVLHALALTHPDPALLFNLADRRLHDLGPRKSVVALAYLAGSPGGDGLDYVLAGQPQPLLVTRAGEVRELPLPAHRIPLGALGVGGYQPLHVGLEPGDVLLGYSDGVVDARSPTGDMFGFERLIEVLALGNDGPADLVRSVTAALDGFVLGADPYDDVTLVAIGRGPTS